MKKKITIILALVLCACTALFTFGCNGSTSFTKGLTYELNASKDGYIVTGLGEATDKDIVIPEKYEGLPIVEIGEKAFANTQIYSVKFPSNLKKIGEKAFAFCDYLESPTLPDSITDIGMYAFYHCTYIENIKIPKNIKTIKWQAFAFCNNLKSVVLNNELVEIEYGAFSACHALTSISFPKKITTIGEKAFAYCKNLNSFSVPSNVKTIGKEAFMDCEQLVSVKFSEGLTSLGEQAFYNCYLFTIDLPISLTYIGKKCFYHNDKLSAVTFGNTNNWMQGTKAVPAEYLIDAADACSYFTSSNSKNAWSKSV